MVLHSYVSFPSQSLDFLYIFIPNKGTHESAFFILHTTFVPTESNMAAQRTLWSSLAIIMAMLMEFVKSANYTVGAPNGGWDSSTDLQAWASSQSFLVGDNLSKYLFSHKPNSIHQHRTNT